MDYAQLKKEYEENGFVKIAGMFKDEVKQIEEKLNSFLQSDEDVYKYTDNQGILRRLEKIGNKKEFIDLNKKIANLLKEVFGEEMILFKDKYNVKPPKGEGFFAHYDSVFTWIDKDGEERKGWYEYCDTFFNVLVAIDEANEENGALEVAKWDKNKLSYDELYERTVKDGSERLDEDFENSLNFKRVDLKPGDIVIFSDLAPHRSKINMSETKSRRILYFTYNKKSDGDFYNQYFEDKYNSKEKDDVSKGFSNKLGS